MDNVAKNPDVLRKRLRRLLGASKRDDRGEMVRVILPALTQVGNIALFGGAIRDVARLGNENFKSDLDFVVSNVRVGEYQQMLRKHSAIPNKFGGYRLKFSRWRVDIWALEDTWARKEGYKTVNNVKDLLECTFFDCDAAIFDLETGEIFTKENYYHRLSCRTMEINFAPNPNPKGSMLRALRRALTWQGSFGVNLTGFVYDELNKHEWSDILDLEKRAFSHAYLNEYNKEEIMNNLCRLHIVGNQILSRPFTENSRQLELFSFR